jgi:uncharacterized phosphosugar-binding protein
MTLAEKYFQMVKEQIEALGNTQMPSVETAAGWFAEAISAGRLVYIFGTGHSHMLAEELFYRAGGLASIVPMLQPQLMLHESASASTQAERDPEIVEKLLQQYPMSRGDVLVVASNSGRNACPVELALAAKGRSVRTIALLNAAHSSKWASRHSSGKRLGDVADLVVDNCGVEGDACVPLPESNLSVGATSSVTGCLIMQMIACRATEMLYAAGTPPDLYQSSNANNDQRNAVIITEYKQNNPHL